VFWDLQNNAKHEDFDCYSTLEDALDDKNPWNYASNYDNHAGRGFPNYAVGISDYQVQTYQWTSLTDSSAPIKDYKYTVFAPGSSAQKECIVNHASPGGFGEMNKFVESMLTNFNFRCPNSSEGSGAIKTCHVDQGSYADILKHTSRCTTNRFKCPLNCIGEEANDPKSIKDGSLDEIK